jgi:hypothetical protein
MEFKKALNKLIKTKEFKDWHNDNKDFFLTNAFVKDGQMQIGYCRKEDNKIVSFIVHDKGIEKFEDEIFKRPDSKLREINIENVEIDVNKALKFAQENKEKFYPQEDINKEIIILHNSDNGEVWNITLISNSFNMLNFKINAKNGELISREKKSLLQLGKEIN